MSNIDDFITMKLIKKFSSTKIDNLEEYITLVACVDFYSINSFYASTEIENKEEKAKDIIENYDKYISLYAFRPLAKEGITKEWISEAFYVMEEIRKNLSIFLENKDLKYYQNAIDRLWFYCQKNQSNFEEWKEELLKFEKGLKKSVKTVFIIFGILIMEAIFLSSQVKKEKNMYSTTQEEQVDFEDYSFDEEEIDADMILKRKF